MPPTTKPDPSALQVVRTLPLHAAAFSVQSLVLHVPVAASQNWVGKHVWTSVDVSPVTLHCRDSLPMQKRLPGEHTPVTH